MHQVADNTEIAYLAGFFDGEGNIRIAKNSKNARGYYLRISATQVDPAPLRMFQKRFVGHLYKRPPRRGKDGCTRQAIWDWVIAGPKAAEVLKTLLPFLVVKQDAAMLGIAFQDCVHSRPNLYKALTTEELAERKYYFDALAVRQHRPQMAIH